MRLEKQIHLLLANHSILQNLFLNILIRALLESLICQLEEGKTAPKKERLQREEIHQAPLTLVNSVVYTILSTSFASLLVDLKP